MAKMLHEIITDASSGTGCIVVKHITTTLFILAWDANGVSLVKTDGELQLHSPQLDRAGALILDHIVVTDGYAAGQWTKENNALPQIDGDVPD